MSLSMPRNSVSMLLPLSGGSTSNEKPRPGVDAIIWGMVITGNIDVINNCDRRFDYLTMLSALISVRDVTSLLSICCCSLL